MLVSVISFSQNTSQKDSIVSVKKDTVVPLKYNFRYNQEGSIFLNNPSTKEVIYDAAINKFVIIEKVGDYRVGNPIFMTPEQYDEYKLKNDIKGYYKQKTGAISKKEGNDDAKRNLLPKYYVNSKFFESIFGGTEVDVIPGGQVNIRLGAIYQKSENPLISADRQSTLNLDFDQQISTSIQATVGTRVKVTANFDSQSTFDFQNVVKLEYIAHEDDILQKLDVGNISFPINNSLITGAQSLFGVRADLQFGKTTVRTAISQQTSESKTVVAEGGSAIQEFELLASDYDNDRHFFLSQFFKETYDKALVNYPLISSPINITRVEVWVTNTNQNVQDYRNIVAFADIGETDFNGSNHIVNTNVSSNNPPTVGFGGALANLPSNDANNLDDLLTVDNGIRTTTGLSTALAPFGMTQGVDYSYLQNARKLTTTEYNLNSQLGYISLNRRLNDGEVLAVAYEYTVVGASNGTTVFKVGEFSTDGITAPSNLAVKLLRSEITKTTRDNDIDEPFPTWELMMKNVYALGAYPLQQENFLFELMYRDDEIGVLQNTFQNIEIASTDRDLTNKTLLNLFNIDRLDQSQFVVDNGDGFFDFVEGVTVNSRNGLIFFTKVEPFGQDLENIFTDSANQDKFVFNELYLTTKANAKNQYQDKDKFYLKGYYKSESSNGISLGAFNIPRGSVRVTAAGRTLVEGVDYVVDYQLGRVQILDLSLQASGTPINATVENNTFFNQQRKSFIGVDVEHKVSDNFILGATFLNVTEKPITPKINFGAEPINNVMLGFNVDYSTEVPFFTKLANKLPNVETDVVSNLSVRGDFAYLLPGSPSGIDVNGAATAYLDDFEGSQIPIDLGSPSSWFLASTPNTQGFNGEISNDLSINDNRSKLAWYSIDQLFYGSSNTLPSNINNDETSRSEVRLIRFNELFENVDLDATQLNLVSTLDLAYYPAERGPYNFNINNALPEENWGGIMRSLTTNNFEEANVEYIQFWLLNPYENYSIREEEGLPSGVDPELLSNQVGKLVFNLGNLSEDILKDGNKQYENGLPEDGFKVVGENVTESAWGFTPEDLSILYAFSNEDGARANQDVGLDGLTDAEEAVKFPQFASLDDPAGDNFQFFRGSALDTNNASILTRYKNFNNTQGNSPTADQSLESFPTAGTTLPDVEDINRDQTMNEVSSYFEYEISLNATDLVVGSNNIVDSKETVVPLANGGETTATWYQVRIPVRTGFSDAVNISDFNSIRFMRMFLTGFKMPVVLRMGELELVRGDWRRYTRVLDPNDANSGEDLEGAALNNFEVGAVSIEENEQIYALPPGIEREELRGTSALISQNEQSATLKVTELESNKIRAMFKNLSIDMRRYKNLRMFLHLDDADANNIENDEMVAIIRFGTDLDNNYYQVEKSLKVSEDSNVPEIVWPEENNLEVNLEELAALKLARDVAGFSLTDEFNGIDTNGLVIKVKGSPTLAQIKTVMLGVKNNADDGLPRTGEVWFNELRAVGFDNKGGWASSVNINANFADVADVSLTGSISTVGFGSVESRVQERSLEDTKDYNINTNVQLGKVLPKKWNMQIPMSYNYGEQFIDPEFDEGYQDVRVKEVLKSGSEEAKANAENTRDYTRRKGISFVNVKKNKSPESKKKPKFYDVENVSATYAYSEEFHKDYIIEEYTNQNLLAGLSYNFNFSPLNIEPFKKSKLFKGKNWKIIRDINFNPIPNVLAVNSKINRNFIQQKSRNLVEDFDNIIQPTLRQRNFFFDWDYTVGFNLTKSLTLNFNATNNHIYDSFRSDDETGIYDKFLEIGRPNQYHQKLNGTYKIPINKIKSLNFISADYGYTGDFDWQGASQSTLASGLTFEEVVGNTIQNSNTHNLNTNIDFNKFYRNIGVNNLFSKRKKNKTVAKGSKNTLRKSVASNRNVKLSKNASTGKRILKGVVDVVTSIKKMKVSYSQNNGTLLQGYKPRVGLFGRDNYNGGLAPNLGFVLGGQTDILNTSIKNGWLVSRAEGEEFFNKSYGKTKAEQIDYNISAKPFKDITIDFRGNRIKTSALNQQLDYIEGNSSIEDVGSFETGNYSISHSMLGTVFKNSDDLFANFLSYRSTIAERLSEETGLPNSTAAGFQTNGQQAMLPAFLAAYSGKNENSVNTGVFRNIPIPNWTVRYNGLMKKKWFKKRFSSFTLSHAYKSSYTLGGFTNNLLFDVDGNDIPDVNVSGNYQPETLLSTATLIDEFSPLIRLDMKMKSSFSLRGEIRKDRSLTLNFNNSTITDIKGTEFIFGLGYKIKDVKFVTRLTGRKETVKGDINLRADISFRDNLTLIRSIDENNDQITGGEKLFGLKFLADYNLSKSLTASFYYNHNTYEYAISTSFPRQNINAGINIIYNLGN